MIVYSNRQHLLGTLLTNDVFVKDVLDLHRRWQFSILCLFTTFLEFLTNDVVAEFNALADAEALSAVVASGIPLDIVDLTFCRSVTFGPDDLPDADPLTLDLLGGYLDIALERGRAGMAIYDPLAALALANPTLIEFQPCAITVETGANDAYGETKITPASSSHIRISVSGVKDLSNHCLRALEKDATHGSRC